METPRTDTSSPSTHEPARHEGNSEESLDKPLAEEDVHTQEQRNQTWTKGTDESDPRRNEGAPLQTDTHPAETLDRPSELEDKLQDVMSHPHSDAQDTTDTQGEPGPLGGMPKTGSGDQDPMSTAQGSGSE